MGDTRCICRGERVEKLTANALTVLEKRYLLKDKQGEIVETPEQMFDRVAHHVASAEEEKNRPHWIGKFYDMMASLDFLPNSPTFNAGSPIKQLSACFVIPIEDSLSSIMDAAKAQVLTHQSGGGTGFSFSRLRPRDDIVKTTSGVASGPVSFMSIFDTTTQVIKQGGKRRGANMGVLRVDHPDIMEFINSKRNGQLANLNISVAITNNFMKVLLTGGSFSLVNPRTEKVVVSQISAADIFDAICQAAWEVGDPGLFFIDRANHYNPVADVGLIESTNPCGEQALLPWDSCNLGHINLGRFTTPSSVVGRRDVDWSRLEEITRNAVRFLDDVIDVCEYPIPQMTTMAKELRRIGLGVMGWHDLLIKLGIPYASQEALSLASDVAGHLQEWTDEASVELARERGPYLLSDAEAPSKQFRNVTRMTIAPTGTVSIIANASGGIEPWFRMAFKRQILDGEELLEVNSEMLKALETAIVSSEMPELNVESAIEGLVEGEITILELFKNHPQRDLFLTADLISPEWHIKHQATWQKHIDNQISKTVNLPHSATVQDVKEAFLLAWQLNCRSITVYRDGSKAGQPMSVGTEKKVAAQGNGNHIHYVPKDRPEVVKGTTEAVRTGHGKVYVTVNTDKRGDPFEVFTNIGKAGGCNSANMEAVSRLATLALRSGIRAEEVIEQLSGITCCPIVSNGKSITSVPDALSHVLERHISTVTKPDSLTIECPDCHQKVDKIDNCFTCANCGYSKCY